MFSRDRQRKLELLQQIAAIGLVALILIGFYLKVLFF